MNQELPHILHVAGVQAAHIAWLWRVMLAVSVTVFIAVTAALWRAIVRARRNTIHQPSEARLGVAVAAATGITIVALFALLGASVWTGRATQAMSRTGALHVRVTGHQWWWDVEYPGNEARDLVRTANEIHLPTGQPVLLELYADDVIHSYWVPNLHGKVDLVPGRRNEMLLQVDRPGVFRGVCAEFCGLQHAKMAILVVADTPARFTEWLAEERAGARSPMGADAQAGARLFAERGCAMCHGIRGAEAGATTAPDLTHVGRRLTLAAGALPHSPETLDQWIADPQAIKPGNKMPRVPLNADDRRRLVAYLESLR